MGSPESDERYVGYDTPKKTLFQLVQVLVASDFKTWPDEGGVLDQDAIVFEDMANLLALYHRRRPEKKEDGEDADNEDSNSAPDYTNYL